ncbi:hypothetical protein GCM10009687_38700 [Asanoa iriomotensis]|uniref:Uncharacterized protein n=1 Tax=Asanoa iriomotensis TaxID=234613 RepID=A0ABQ4CF98_9ACTN|nr:hypothetical protein Air01nite_75380 [Asanoa iriomotensis]
MHRARLRRRLVLGLRELDKSGVVAARQAEGIGERSERAGPRAAGAALFEVADGADADPGTLRKLLLRHATTRPRVAERSAEVVLPPIVHARSTTPFDASAERPV